MDQITLTIDGREVRGEKGQTVLEVALKSGIKIPYLCYHPKISKTGACRVCLVRINGTILKASCVEPITEGMNVITEDEEIVKIRKWILELLLSDGDHNCLYCEANGACEFQALIQRYNIGEVKPDRQRTIKEVDYESSNALRRNENRCILCGRCVKACKEIQVSNVWSFAERGSHTHLVADDGMKIGESSCVKCGTCAQLCPTGAITFQTVSGRGANWELTSIPSICIYCGVGCKIDFYKNREGVLVKTMGNDTGPNNGHLCVKGRFGFDFVQSDKRLTTPLIKKNGVFEEASWDEALDLVATRLTEIKEKYGSDSIGSLSSAKCTNEENYLMQKFMRAVIGTNNVDHCARL
jgi:predicted molibdopterin-dependent oxidoreductase YjgC